MWNLARLDAFWLRSCVFWTSSFAYGYAGLADSLGRRELSHQVRMVFSPRKDLRT